MPDDAQVRLHAVVFVKRLKTASTLSIEPLKSSFVKRTLLMTPTCFVLSNFDIELSRAVMPHLSAPMEAPLAFAIALPAFLPQADAAQRLPHSALIELLTLTIL